MLEKEIEIINRIIVEAIVHGSDGVAVIIWMKKI